MDIVILCGGLGTRLQSVVSDRPKALALINDRPFLSYQLSFFKSAGYTRFIFCIGYKADMIKAYIQSISETELNGCECVFSVEDEPLGTGGALFKAQECIHSDKFMLVNGDSFCDVDLRLFTDFHSDTNALMSMVVVSVEDFSRYGVVYADDQKKIQGFSEKGDDSGLDNPGSEGEGDDCVKEVAGIGINAGIYILNKTLFNDSNHQYKPGDKFSLETDFFPKYVGHHFFAYKNLNTTFIDIGLPSSLQEAQTFFNTQKFNNS